MYREFFGLTTCPFNNTPDPRFFFNTPDHEEALASLLYAVEQRKGFVLITGEVGAGKTLISRLLLNRLNSTVRTAVITNTRLSADELLLAICREFEIDVEGCTSAAELTHLLEEFLLEQYARDRLAIVILDEAQNLPLESLEELRMLGNLEADDAKLLQILILGQPELQESFREPSMRQTYQRLFRTFHLRALDQKLTGGYITHRLGVAGAAPEASPFDKAALEAVFQASVGIPRLINQICDNALLAAYGESKRNISAKMIREVVSQMMSTNAPAPAPTSEFARQMLGIPNELVADTQVIGTQLRRNEVIRDMAERIGSMENELSSLKDRHDKPTRRQRSETHGIKQHGGMLNDLEQKFESIEAAIEAVQRDTQSLHAQNRGLELDVDATRKMQQSAGELLKSVTGTAQKAERHMREMLTKAHKAADAIEGRALSGVETAQKESELLRNQARCALEEVQAFTTKHQQKITQMISDGQSEIDTCRNARRQVDEACKHIEIAQARADERHQQVITEACETSSRTAAESRGFIEEAKSQTRAMQEQLRTLLDEVRAKANASQERAGELIAQQRSDIEEARANIDSFTVRMREQTAELQEKNKGIVDYVKDQATSVVSEIHQLRDRTQVKSGDASRRMDELIGEMQERITESQESVDEIVASAETEVRSACVSLQTTREQTLAEAEDNRWHSSELLDQTKDLLAKTREECSLALAELREQVAEQTANAESVWQTSVAGGTETLETLNARLEEATRLSEKSRSDLTSLLGQAHDELAKTRDSLQSSLESHKSDIARLSKDAVAIKSDFQKRFEDARAMLDAVLHKHRTTFSSQVADFARKTDERIATLKNEAQKKIAEHLARFDDMLNENITDKEGRIGRIKEEVGGFLRETEARLSAAQSQAAQEAIAALGEVESAIEERMARSRSSLSKNLDEASATAERICTGLKNSISVVQANAAECQARFESESDVAQAELLGLVSQNRTALEELRSEMEALEAAAGETAGSAEKRINELNGAATAHVAEVSRNLQSILTRVHSESEAIRTESEERLVGLAERLIKTREDAATVVASAEQSTAGIRRQSKNSLNEVRDCLEQMNQRSELIRRELVVLGDEVRDAAESTTERLEQTGQRVSEHIENLRASAQKDADANFKRLATVRQQVEQSSEQMRQNAAKLLDQVQSGAADLRQHADDLLSQAQGGSEKLSESASAMLLQAQSTSERFREQSESLLHRAEQAAREIQDEVQDLRSQVVGEVESMRHQILAAKSDMTETRQDAAKLMADAIDAQKLAQTQADRLLERADSAHKQAENLLNMPKDVVEEARSQAKSLSEMSRKISIIIKELNSANESSDHKRLALDQAGQDADGKLGLLKKHTERVGQLVGIIRQLYGTMDSRIERLRGRLTQADDMVRGVPTEIHNLRQMFDRDAQLEGAAANAEMAAPQTIAPPVSDQRNTGPRPAAVPGSAVPQTVAASATATPSRSEGAPNAVHVKSSKGSLGEIVKRNQKLNQWLADMVGEDALEGRITPIEQE